MVKLRVVVCLSSMLVMLCGCNQHCNQNSGNGRDWIVKYQEAAMADISKQHNDRGRRELRNYLDLMNSYRQGDSIDTRDAKGRSLLCYAAMLGNNDLVSRLISLDVYAGIEVSDNSGLTPLMFAVINGNKEIVKMLIEHGACVNVLSKHGDNALSYARKHDRSEIVILLKKAGAEEISNSKKETN